MTGSIRASAKLLLFFVLTLPLMPVQAVLPAVNRRAAQRLPHWYHRQVCRLLGVRLAVTGAVVRDAPVLVISNHVSWLDIVVLSAVAPVSFVAKKQVASWPFVSWLAKLQRTVFVDRERRTSVGTTADEMGARLASGDAIVLFAEGTSSDGNRVLPFKTSLFAAAKPSNGKPSNGKPSNGKPSNGKPSNGNSAYFSGGDANANGALGEAVGTVVQTVSIAYMRRNGLPLGWAGRRAFSYYGDISMGANAWAFLKGGTLEVVVLVDPPIPLADFKDRKDLARQSESAVRAGLMRMTRGKTA